MTNHEKTEELRRYVCNSCMPNGEDALGLLNRTNRSKADLRNIWEVCERTALEMAEWKDRQFKEFLEKKRYEADKKMGDAYENGDQWDYYIAEQNKSLFTEIINELFK